MRHDTQVTEEVDKTKQQKWSWETLRYEMNSALVNDDAAQTQAEFTFTHASRYNVALLLLLLL